MDALEETVRRAAPAGLGSDAAAAAEAAAIARSVAVGGGAARGRFGRRSGARRLLWGAALGVGLLGAGVTAAAAGPTIADWLGWVPDVVAHRSFTYLDGSGSGSCEVYIRVEPVPGEVSEELTTERTEAARRFLVDHDWSPIIDSITPEEIEAAFEADAARRAAAATDTMTPPPATRSGAATDLIADRITDAFTGAGLLQPGVSLEGAAGPCGPDIEGGAG